MNFVLLLLVAFYNNYKPIYKAT